MPKEIENITKVSFVDKNREKFTCELTITHRNGYPEFTMCSEGGQREFVPANQAQEKLLKLWKEWHLNDVKAGTPKQTEALEKWKTAGNKYDYSKAVEYLKCIRPDGTPISALEVKEIESATAKIEEEIEKLSKAEKLFNEAVETYTSKRGSAGWFIFDFKSIGFQHPKIEENVMGKSGRIGIYLDGFHGPKDFFKKVTRHFAEKEKELENEKGQINLRTLWYDLHDGKPYQYGTAWLRKELPTDMEEQIESIVQEVEEAEEERRGESLSHLNDEDLLALVEEKTEYEEDQALLFVALIKMFNLTENDFDDVQLDSNYRCTVQGIEYTAGTDEEMTEAVTEEIEQSVWAFVPSFLASETDLPIEAFEALQEKYESGNDGVLKLIEKTCGIESFVESAVSADGRGHFLNRYDGEEEKIEVRGKMYFAYRTD